MEFKVEASGTRIDTYLSSITDYSRSKIQKLIKDEIILVNDNPISSSYTVKQNDLIKILDFEEETIDLLPEKMDLDIVYEDEYLLVINKKSGIVVHPALGNYNHTLVNGLLYHLKKLGKDKIRPGIVHRIDKDTSGLLIIAKNDQILETLSKMISKKEVERTYLALVWGVVMHEKGTIDAPIGRDINNRQKYSVTDINSKESVTHFKVIDRFKDATLLELKLDTGRTHQIRVHLEYIKHPIVNDEIYCKKKVFNKEFGQMLHSKSLKFTHPVTKKELFFEVAPPKEFLSLLEKFK